MNQINIIMVALMSIITMVSCSKNSLIETVSTADIKEICITGKDFQVDSETRSTVSITESGASFLWDEDDVIGIFPNKGDQVSFAMENGAGTQTATFSGGGWALKSSAKYAAYYPHVYENRDLTQIPVNYVGQTQNGNGNTDHIGAYDFMAAGVSTPENGAVAFDMQHLGALVQLTITVPEPSTITKVVLTSSTEFTETGTIDLTADIPAITADTQSNTFEIALNNIATTEANENVTVYFMVAPIDLSESILTATTYFADETTCEMNIIGKNLKSGKAYRLSAEIEETIPNNQIWYTSSDGNIINPNTSVGFRANIISNTYNNGKGIIIFDKDITTIGERAFYLSNTLTSITIPNSVITIEKDAFDSCYSLADITMPSGLTTICDDAFNLCSSLTNITIPNSVTSIGEFAFANCTGIANFIIPSSVAEIGGYAFSGCSSLSDIIIPASVQSIGSCAFSKCPYLSIEVDTKNSIYDSRDNCNAIIETSSNTLIQGCNNTIIPDNIVKIGNNAFAYCDVENITIPQGVSSIGGAAFFKCYSLKSITIPNSVGTIEGSAFYNCNSLESIIIPQGVTTIESSTFSNCRFLSSISIPSTVTKIGEYAFSGCGSLTNVTIPDSVVEIENGAFNINSYFLSQVHIQSINPPIIYSSNTFDQNAKIYIPAGSIDVYSSADYWKNLNLIEEESPIQAVDLGLSVKWANCNVGANSPEEYGDYFAWGEIYTKDSFSEANYAYYNSTATSSSGKWNFIGRNICGTDYDAAKHILGDGWAMPTYLQMQELIDKCTWTWTTCNDVAGFEIKSNINNNTIFLPAAGFSGNSSSVGYASWCWTGVMYENGTYYGWGYHLNATTNGIQIEGRMRSNGMPIRPVYNE